MRSRHLAFAVLTAALALAPASPAPAQNIDIGPGGIRVDPGFERRERRPRPIEDGISEREAIRIARRQGLDEVRRVRETPRGFVISGFDQNGDDMRVVISADGDVIDVRRD